MKNYITRAVTAFGIAVLLFSVIGCTGLPGRTAAHRIDELSDQGPSPVLSPAEVVYIQMQALKYNDSSDLGIEIAYRFASPTIKSIAGSLSSFASIVKDKEYTPLLNHTDAGYTPVFQMGNKAFQRVRVMDPTGKSLVYLFVLSRQTGPVNPGCWMTESVILEAEQRIVMLA